MDPLIPIKSEVKRKVFVSYHHENDQFYANTLRDFYGASDTFIDKSLDEEIDSDDNDYILSIIRQKHLRNSTVTVVLIGSETWKRKWVDWEIYSSLRPYNFRTVNGLLGIWLPSATKLPYRFSENLISGYARIIKWEYIAPLINPLTPSFKPTLLPQPHVYKERMKRKKLLTEFIEEAFKNRTHTELIENSRDRIKRNLS